MRLLIGYGSLVRGDDGVGQVAAALLADQPWTCEVEIIACHQLMPELAEPLSRAEWAVFVDARLAAPPGQIRCIPVENSPQPAGFAHHVTPASLLHAAQELYGRYPEALLITVNGVCFDYGFTLSPEVQAALARLLAALRRLLDVDHVEAGYQKTGETVL